MRSSEKGYGLDERSSRTLATGRTGTIGQYLSSSVETLEIDLLKVDRILGNLEGATILHLAAHVGSDKVNQDPKLSHAVNVDGTIALAEKALRDNCKKFIFISTSHVYAPRNKPLEENDPVAPISEYANQKLEAEKGVIKVFERNPDKLLILRLFSILGLETRNGTLGGSIRKLLKKEGGTMIRNISDVRDFMTPKQAANVIETISKIESISETILNVCTQKATSLEQAILKLVGEKQFNSMRKQLVYGNSEVPYIVGNKKNLSKYHSTESKF